SNTIASKTRVPPSSTPSLAAHGKRFKLSVFEKGIWIACHKPNASPVHETNNNNKDNYLAEIDETDDAEWLDDDELVYQSCMQDDEIANTKSNVCKNKLVPRKV